MTADADFPGYSCCFCGGSIDQTDRDAVEVVLRNIWINGGRQSYWSHSKCAVSKIGNYYPVEFEGLRDPDLKPTANDPWD